MLKHLLLAGTIVTAPSIHGHPNDGYTLDPATQTVTADRHAFRLGPGTFLLTAETGATSSPYIFTDALKALEAISKNSSGNATLLVTPGVYWLDDPDDPAVRRNPKNSGAIPYAAEISCDTLSLIGLSEDPADIVFAVNRGQTQGALGNYTILHFKGHSLIAENMTFGNYCNVDLIYPRNPSLNRPKRRDAIVQAQVGICENTDRLFARNCRFISRLNLCPLSGARRSLYKDCYFECTDDALSGSAVYLDCRFTFFSGKPFYSTASTGAIFLNCDIHTKVRGSQYLTKVPGMVSMIDTRWTSDSPVDIQWTRDSSPVRCYQSGITLNGTAITIDARRPELSADISDTPLLRAYKISSGGKTVYNILNLLGGTDGWDPLGQSESMAELEKALSATLTGLPVALKIETPSKKLSAQGDSMLLKPSLRLWGDYPAPASPSGLTWNAPTTVRLSASGATTAVVSANSFPREMICEISAVSPYGLTGATSVTVDAWLKTAPQFTSTPVITADKNTLKLDYSLSGNSRDDSHIIWYRSTRPDHSDSVAVRHGRGLSARSYPLTCADRGFYISASVMPKNADSEEGHAMVASMSAPVNTIMLRSLQKSEKSIVTSFAEVPIRKGTPGRQGFWHFDTFKPSDTALHDWTPDGSAGWYYGHGTDAATGIGLVQSTKGARLFYTPVREKCRNMRVSLIAEPCKGPGQGFGSATGQYMDICIKFDPVSLTGYALRIERTPDFNKAVTFTLVQYSSGAVSPISKAVATSCYRNPCTIVVELRGDRLTALARTGAPAAEAADPAIKPDVSLSATVSPTDGTSLAIQHTGSAGASATLLRDLEVNWD